MTRRLSSTTRDAEAEALLTRTLEIRQEKSGRVAEAEEE